MADILVTGATGTVGGAVARGLDAAGVRHRTASRRGDGGEGSVRLDLTDPGTWDAAFGGVRRLFLIRPPQLARPRRDLVPALVRARALGVEQVVFLSVQGADRNPLLPHAAVERWLRASGLAWTFLRASYFMQNLQTVHRADLVERDLIAVPAGDGATSFVDADDVGALGVAALLEPERHAGRAWTPTGPAALTYGQVAEVLGEVLGRPVRYSRPGVLAYVRHARRTAHLSPGLLAVTTVLYTTARLGLAGRVTDDVREALGRPATSFADFAAREADSWRR